MLVLKGLVGLHRTVQLQLLQHGKEMQKSKMAIWRSLTNSCEKKRVLLLLTSLFCRVRLYTTPSTAAHQAPPALGFSRQEHWSRLPFPFQCMKGKYESEVAQSCPTLRDPMDCSLPGSSDHGIFQTRILEWVAIA